MIASMLGVKGGMSAALLPALWSCRADSSVQSGEPLWVDLGAILPKQLPPAEPLFVDAEPEATLICTNCGCCPSSPHADKCPNCGAGRDSLKSFE